MKNLFLRLFLALDAATGGAVANVVEFKSELLTKLKAEKKALWAEVVKHEDPDTQEALAAKLAYFKKEGEIKAEIQRMEKEAAEQKITEQRNIRIGMNTAQFNAYDNLLAVKAKKGVTSEQIAEAQTAFNTAKELVENELIKQYSKPAKAATTGEANKGGNSGENKAAILALFAQGKNHKEIEDAGYARSTVWHALDKAAKAGEIVKNW